MSEFLFFKKQPKPKEQSKPKLKFSVDELRDLLDNDEKEKAIWYIVNWKSVEFQKKMPEKCDEYFPEIMEKGAKKTIELFYKKDDFDINNIISAVQNKVYRLYLDKIGEHRPEIYLEELSNEPEIDKDEDEDEDEYQQAIEENIKALKKVYALLAKDCHEKEKDTKQYTNCVCCELLKQLGFDFDFKYKKGSFIQLRDKLLSINNIEEADQKGLNLLYTEFKKIYSNSILKKQDPKFKTSVHNWLRQKKTRCFEKIIEAYNLITEKKVKNNDYY